MPADLLILHVYIHVDPAAIAPFRDATLANARASLEEPGVVRFDVVQDRSDPTQFALLEVYRDADAHAAHRETPHYKAWREAVDPLMAEPRTNRKFSNVFPDENGW